MSRTAVNLTRILLGLLLSAAARIAVDGQAPLLYFGILPGLPFVIMGLLGLFPRIPSAPLRGSAIGARIVTVLSYGAFFLDAALHPGDVRFGVIVLFIIPLPLYYAFAIIVGGLVGAVKASAKPISDD